MEDLKTVHYVTQDPLRNLKIKITLTRLSAARAKARGEGHHQTGFDTAAGAHTDQNPASQAGNAAASGTDGSPAAPSGTDTAGAAASNDAHQGQQPQQPQQQVAAAAAAAAARPGRPEPVTVNRTFSWQEKVYSKAELVAAQAHIRAKQQQGGPISTPSRAAHFGSAVHIGADKLLSEDPEGSLLFTYVQNDDFCDRALMSKAVTTSTSEPTNHLVRRLLGDARSRQRAVTSRYMYIMADLGDEHTVAGSNEKVLVCIQAQADGSFDMRPGFMALGGARYRFEDDHGGIYEYTVENASKTAAPSLEKRAAKLQRHVVARADEMRRGSAKMDFTPPPGPSQSAVRLLLMAELVAASDFRRDRLYIEYQVSYEPELWVLQSPLTGTSEPGRLKGVTQVSKLACYPADPAEGGLPTWVAHFAHPIEAEWIAREVPPPGKWPMLLFQVCSYDKWDRYTTEGYGWLQLDGSSPGTGTHYVNTWKPLGTVRDQQQAFFIGGAPELEDMAYIAVPRDFSKEAGRPLNKYGLKTQSSGIVKVRINTLLQRGSRGGVSPTKAAANRNAAANAAGRQRREVSLAVVLERARARLQEARGGDVALREGLVSERPYVKLQPVDMEVDEGATVELTISAGGMEPLRYQWYRDDKRLTVATSNSPSLIMVGVAAPDSGSYHCQVSNKDGAINSGRASLGVRRLSRFQRAAAAEGHGDDAPGTPRMAATLGRRTTLGRPLGRSGSGLPFSPHGGASSPGPDSPLRRSITPDSANSPLRRSMAGAGEAGASPLRRSGGSLAVPGSSQGQLQEGGVGGAGSVSGGRVGREGVGAAAPGTPTGAGLGPLRSRLGGNAAADGSRGSPRQQQQQQLQQLQETGPPVDGGGTASGEQQGASSSAPAEQQQQQQAARRQEQPQQHGDASGQQMAPVRAWGTPEPPEDMPSQPAAASVSGRSHQPPNASAQQQQQQQQWQQQAASLQPAGSGALPSSSSPFLAAGTSGGTPGSPAHGGSPASSRALSREGSGQSLMAAAGDVGRRPLSRQPSGAPRTRVGASRTSSGGGPAQ